MRMPLVTTRIEATNSEGRTLWHREAPMELQWAQHVAEEQFRQHAEWSLVEVMHIENGEWVVVHEVHTPWML